VVYAIEKGKALEDLTIPEFRQFSDVVGDDVYDILSLQSCLDKRCAKGGVSPLRVAEAIAEAKAIKAQLEAEETVVEFVEKVGPDGRTFGSITNKKIAEELQKQFGIKIDKRHIQVQAPIRAVGLIDVPVKIYQDITSVINLRVKEG